jgi:light-regulated signal transduction histidine kinase (bacteriophytochrome)
VIEDISQRKAIQDELDDYREQLEKRVEERTVQLQAAYTDLESFSYSVSHDLRAPLRAIDGFSAILLEDYAPRLDDEGKRLFRVVGDNARKMGQLIDDILAFSRAGRIELLVTNLDMNALAQEVWQELEPQRAGRSVEFRLAALPTAYGDPAAIRQVLQNFLANALKFTRGRESALIELGGRQDSGESIFYVRDNGAGFDMDYVNRLFGLFQRLHGMDEFEGTGVGLAIVKRFVAKHGGRVWAEGRLGEGATFWFTLPPAKSGAINKETAIG